MTLTLIPCTAVTTVQQPCSAALAVPTAADRIAAFNLAVRDYPALFDGLTGDHLRDLERAGNEDSPSDRIEQLLPVLEDWQRRLDAFEGALSARDLANIMAWGATSPTGLAYRQAAASRDSYLRCRDAAHSAWVNWSFTGIDLDDEEAGARTGDDAEAPEVDETEIVPCVLDGCDGYGHPDDCTRRLEEMTLQCGLEVSTELVSSNVEGVYISVFGMYGADSTMSFDEAINVHARTQADLDQLAADFERLAAMIRRAGAGLPSVGVVQLVQGACARCERSWPESDLSEDANGDPVCCDCASSDHSAEDTAACRAYRAGR